MFFHSIGLAHYLSFSSALMIIGLFGLISNRSSIISYIISLEIMFLAVNLMLVSISKYVANLQGQTLLIFTLCVTAAEISVILGLAIFHYKTHNTISSNSLNTLSEE
ncbi:NADH-quinone oxidoreductase subunit NuoK [Candidatus Deianiraea vastatrix]|uniref:NADH-quinone oxidoreductase subunit K n=1 Tax=Candidatus Deianiraea vastatrix TaxID=2163644 RepID=A0A5B8XI60_9RICK|nr:NADH-quinone oxidoreductase subunit NuoK [Candidatus Deianiraea vastatrix]QED23704.1 NADH-quinone oxidoreductase subunit K [Candidatus Deianiraea vastatrix]